MSQLKKLTLTQIDEGRRKTLINADRLVKDAKILLENDSWARAFFLSQLSLEELGKYMMLMSVASNPYYEKIDWKKFWKLYKTHKSNTSDIPLLKFLFTEMESLRGFKASLKRYQEENEHVSESLRMVLLHSDFHKNRFHSPMETINIDLATSWVSAAERYLDSIKSFDEKIIGLEGLRNLRKENSPRVTKKG